MSLKKTERGESKEIHTYRELCEDLFRMKLDIAVDFHTSLTQADIDEMSQMIRLANEKKIQALGLDSKIDSVYREQAEMNRTLETTMEEGRFYRLLDGGDSIDL